MYIDKSARVGIICVQGTHVHIVMDLHIPNSETKRLIIACICVINFCIIILCKSYKSVEKY